ncbi:MAG: glutathione peroxidase [Ferrovibrio sp.]|nr:glutathione peroxidase [Ferrovibrio sp.]
MALIRRRLLQAGLVFLSVAALPFRARAKTGMSFHDFDLTGIDGKPLPLKQYKGKVVLLVNTASQCGFTPQYTDLQAVWAKYRERGLVVLGVPSNDFGGQEPGTAAQIKEFCEVNFDVDFPLADKQKVSGAEAHPVYKWLAAEFGELAKPRWNFHKYLIAGDGSAVDWFSTATKPTEAKVTKAIEAELAKLKPA